MAGRVALATMIANGTNLCRGSSNYGGVAHQQESPGDPRLHAGSGMGDIPTQFTVCLSICDSFAAFAAIGYCLPKASSPPDHSGAFGETCLPLTDVDLPSSDRDRGLACPSAWSPDRQKRVVFQSQVAFGERTGLSTPQIPVGPPFGV